MKLLLSFYAMVLYAYIRSMVKNRTRVVSRANFARNRARARMAHGSRASSRARTTRGPLATRKGILSNPLSKEKFNY